MLNYSRIIPAFILLIIMVCSCDNGGDPEQFSELHPAPYTLPSSIELPETVYLAAGYDCYPNDLDFGYTYDWVKVSTYKEPDTNKGFMRISWEANRSENPRKVLIYLGYSERVVIELTQK